MTSFRRDRDLREHKPRETDTQFITDVAERLQARDETETPPEDREALRAEIRQELLTEMHRRLVVSPPNPEPAPRAGFVRDESLDIFFEKVEAEKAERRRRRGH
jgi:hypothetical protein